jgi:hypothetical protein
VEVSGLEMGKTYWAHEIKAPKGYTLAKEDVKFTFNSDKIKIKAPDVPIGKILVDTPDKDGGWYQTDDPASMWLYLLVVLAALITLAAMPKTMKKRFANINGQ